MWRIGLAGLILLWAAIDTPRAQTVNLTSVDVFMEVAATLKAGNPVTAAQWEAFDKSAAYREFATRDDKSLISIIKASLGMAFGSSFQAERDTVLLITQLQMNNNPQLLLKKLILTNYLDAHRHFDSLTVFRNHYDFDALVRKARQRLFTFLEKPADTTITLKPVYFLFISADGKNKEEALYVDFNLLFQLNETQRINFLAHEFFHNYREKFERHEFNYQNYLNFFIDAIQNEGIADQIDKTQGYQQFFTDAGESPEMVANWVELYDQAPNDLERLHQLVLRYATGEITEKEVEVAIQEIVRYNGHPIGFYMSNQIADSGKRSAMLQSFHNPYEFYCLYNSVAKERGLFLLSDRFLTYLKGLTEPCYR